MGDVSGVGVVMGSGNILCVFGLCICVAIFVCVFVLQ